MYVPTYHTAPCLKLVSQKDGGGDVTDQEAVKGKKKDTSLLRRPDRTSVVPMSMPSLGLDT